VRSGLVASLARPGGNVTGFEPFATDLTGKRVELLREALPGVTRIGRMVDLSNPVYRLAWNEQEAAARSLGLETHLLDVRKSADLAPAFEAAAKLRLGGTTVSIDGLMSANREAIVELAARHRIPAIYGSRDFVEAGGLMSYAVDYRALYARAATYVDRILKGAKPGDLPVEQATKLELVVNLKTAKALGITIPASILLRANEVIE
jgi:putative ABC transport system substrate-binding protein